MDAHDRRPDPETLLRRARSEEAEAARGRLKLFFGAAPGVGKTYAMLEAARARKREGWDVLVGVVETHGRAETAALLDGLQVLPRREVEHGGVRLAEFDLDGALRRRPRLIVVDELAHTNAPGSRHAKRWQDVAELLDAGIDVYTTLNVQHWESLNDVVAGVTGVRVRETVPDAFLEAAHEIELVDLAPEDLLRRLKDGKVYAGETAARAADNFFKPANLAALREMALRHAAERVDAQRARMGPAGAGAVSERLLVGVSTGPSSARLVRAAARLAARQRAPWIAALIETPALLARPAAERARATETLRLAASLGGDPVTVVAENTAEALAGIVRRRGVTQILLGRPAHPRWRDRLFGSLVDDVARRCTGAAVVVLGTDEAPAAEPASPQSAGRLEGLAAGAAAAALVTLACWPLSAVFDRVNLAMLYLLGVVLAAFRGGRGAAVWSSVLGVLAFDFFFVPPRLTFAVADTQYLMTFAVMLAVGLLTGGITARLRLQAAALAGRAARLDALYRLSHELSAISETGALLRAAERQIAAFYRRPVLVLVPGPGGEIEPRAGDTAAFGWSADEAAVARWAYDHGRAAGAGSETLAGAAGLYTPMKTPRGTAGVLALRPSATEATLLCHPDERRLLEAFAAEIGAAHESTRLSEEIGRAEAQMERQAVAGATPPAGGMLAGAFAPDRVLRFDEATEEREILRRLLTSLNLPAPARAFEAILKRERSGPVRLGALVRAPHARIEGLDAVRAAVALTPANPEKVWVLFVSPLADPAAHLGFLAGLAAFFRDDRRAAALAALPPGEAFELIRRPAADI